MARYDEKAEACNTLAHLSSMTGVHNKTFLTSTLVQNHYPNPIVLFFFPMYVKKYIHIYIYIYHISLLSVSHILSQTIQGPIFSPIRSMKGRISLPIDVHVDSTSQMFVLMQSLERKTRGDGFSAHVGSSLNHYGVFSTMALLPLWPPILVWMSCLRYGATLHVWEELRHFLSNPSSATALHSHWLAILVCQLTF